MAEHDKPTPNYTFKISVYSGDIIYALAGIKHVCEARRTKADLFIWLDRKWDPSVPGQLHPYGVNRYAFDMIKPLIEAQPYISSVQEFRGQNIACDLDKIRRETITTMPLGSIMRWQGHAWPDMQPDAGKDWIHPFITLYSPNGISKANSKTLEPIRIPEEVKNKIIINRTSRWRNDLIHYWFLKDFKDDLIFAGLPEEHSAFCKEWELDIPLLKVNDFLELAIAIASCRYFIGNQSLCFALAEAMKVPRLLEVCPYAPNVIPCGPHGYDFLHQFAFEWMVKDKESPLNNL